MTDDSPETTSAHPTNTGKPEKDRRISPKLAVSGVLAVLLLLFGVLNTDDVGVDFIIDTVKAPLILVIGLSATLGLVIGMLLRGRHDHKKD